MVDINISFCRELLRLTLKDVAAYTTSTQRKNVSVLKSGTTNKPWFLVEGLPEPLTYWEGSADNAYHARHKAWNAWLRKKGAPNYFIEAV